MPRLPNGRARSARAWPNVGAMRPSAAGSSSDRHGRTPGSGSLVRRETCLRSRYLTLHGNGYCYWNGVVTRTIEAISVLEHASDAVFVTTDQFLIEWVNEAAVGLLGYPRDTL